MASNCSNFTSVDLRVKQKTVLNRAEVDESNEYSSKRGGRSQNDSRVASTMTSFEALLAFLVDFDLHHDSVRTKIGPEQSQNQHTASRR